ncbi:alpha-hydroxy-acid oxidizing protein, partial [Acinetobacter baumannii]
DAKDAVRFGADGIVVSNHGGRQLDGVMSSARALPAIADAVKGDLAILADSGIRNGVFTPTGFGTLLAEGKETRHINGKDYVLEYPIKADF